MIASYSPRLLGPPFSGSLCHRLLSLSHKTSGSSCTSSSHSVGILSLYLSLNPTLCPPPPLIPASQMSHSMCPLTVPTSLCCSVHLVLCWLTLMSLLSDSKIINDWRQEQCFLFSRDCTKHTKDLILPRHSGKPCWLKETTSQPSFGVSLLILGYWVYPVMLVKYHVTQHIWFPTFGKTGWQGLVFLPLSFPCLSRNTRSCPH